MCYQKRKYLYDKSISQHIQNMNYQEQYPRINIHQEARLLKEKGYIWPEIDPLQGVFTYQSPEVIDVWKKQKPEFYKVSGVILDRGITRAVQARPQNEPYGLMKLPNYSPATALYDFNQIGFDMAGTLNKYIEVELESLQELSKTSSTDPIQSTYKRFQEYFFFIQNYINKEQREDLFLAGGISTAADIMSHTLYAIPYVVLAEAKCIKLK